MINYAASCYQSSRKFFCGYYGAIYGAIGTCIGNTASSGLGSISVVPGRFEETRIFSVLDDN